MLVTLKQSNKFDYIDLSRNGTLVQRDVQITLTVRHPYSLSLYCINSLAPGRSEFDYKNVIVNLVLLIGIFSSCHDNAFWWMPQDLTDDKSTLIQVMAWCRQATSHYLSQCWLSSLSPYGIARSQWVKRCCYQAWIFFQGNAFFFSNLLHCISTYRNLFFTSQTSKIMHFFSAYVEYGSKLFKSTCPSGSFICLGLSSKGICWALHWLIDLIA